MMGSRVGESLMMERRITLRLLGYWEKLRGQRLMPTEQELDPSDIHDLWDSCMLVRVDQLTGDDSAYTYMGQSIIDMCSTSVAAEGKSLLAGFNNSSLMLSCKKVIDSRKPLLDEGEFYNLHKELVKYRLCLLPLGDGQDVQAVFGGMRFKIYRS